MRILKQYIIQDIQSNIHNYLCYTLTEAKECFNAECGKENFGVLVEVIKKIFYCPNCKRGMCFEDKVEFDGGDYDKWTCEDCVHIILLDYRGDSDEVQ